MVKAVLFDWGSVLRSKAGGRRAKPVYDLVDELRSHGIKTGIVSNIYSIFAKLIRLTGDYNQFDPVILSCDVKIKKPGIGIYKVAIKRLNLRPEELLFVDNRVENVAAAQELGMKVVLAKDSNQTAADVKKIILEENGLKL